MQSSYVNTDFFKTSDPSRLSKSVQLLHQKLRVFPEYVLLSDQPYSKELSIVSDLEALQKTILARQEVAQKISCMKQVFELLNKVQDFRSSNVEEQLRILAQIHVKLNAASVQKVSLNPRKLFEIQSPHEVRHFPPRTDERVTEDSKMEPSMYLFAPLEVDPLRPSFLPLVPSAEIRIREIKTDTSSLSAFFANDFHLKFGSAGMGSYEQVPVPYMAFAIPTPLLPAIFENNEANPDDVYVMERKAFAEACSFFDSIVFPSIQNIALFKYLKHKQDPKTLQVFLLIEFLKFLFQMKTNMWIPGRNDLEKRLQNATILSIDQKPLRLIPASEVAADEELVQTFQTLKATLHKKTQERSYIAAAGLYMRFYILPNAVTDKEVEELPQSADEQKMENPMEYLDQQQPDETSVMVQDFLNYSHGDGSSDWEANTTQRVTDIQSNSLHAFETIQQQDLVQRMDVLWDQQQEAQDETQAVPEEAREPNLPVQQNEPASFAAFNPHWVKTTLKDETPKKQFDEVWTPELGVIPLTLRLRASHTCCSDLPETAEFVEVRLEPTEHGNKLFSWYKALLNEK